MPPPLISPEQRADALAKAVAARKERGDLKSRLKRGQTTIAEILEDAKDSDVIAMTRVAGLLTSLPGIGPARARQIMERHGIPAGRRVRGLGANQVTALSAEFDTAAAAA